MRVLNSDLGAEPVIFGAYGDEQLPLPIITGARNLPTNESQPWETTQNPHVYKKQLSSTFSNRYPAYLSRDGQIIPMGRFPNFNIENAGGLRIQNRANVVINNVTRTEITDTLNLKNPEIQWIGGEFVSMPNTWLYTKGPILEHDTTRGKMIMALSGYAIVAGKGYFIQNHINALDLEGEWSYDNTGMGTFYIYTQSHPNNSTFMYSHSSFGFDFGSSTADNFVFENIHFNYYNDACIRLNSNAIGRKIIIQNCQFTNSYNGLVLKANEGIIVKNCTFENIRNNAITIEGKKIRTEGNVIKKIAIDPGSGDTFNNGYLGISFVGQDGVCRLNKIDSVGYNAIRFEGQNLLIERNEVSNFTINKNDGGGIYSFNGFFAPSSNSIYFPNYKYGGNIVRENIIHDGKTSYILYSFGGTREIGGNRSVGIYSDNNSMNNTIEKNILYNLNANAILMQTSADSITVRGNIFYKTQTPEMSTIQVYNSNQLNYHLYNPTGEAQTGNKKIDIQDNLFIENYPIQNNWRYKAGRSGIAQRNKYYRFDFNKNDVIFNFDTTYGTENLSLLDVQKKYSEELESLWMPIQPVLKKVQLGTEILQNPTFSGSTVTPWFVNRQQTNGTTKLLSTAGIMDGGYLEINITGGSFTATNHYFQLGQAINVEKDKLYHLKFSYYSNQTTASENKNMAITIGNSPKIWINTPTSRKEYDIYLIPAQSGSTNLTMTVTVPYANIKYFFDNLSLKEVQNYSAKQEDYEFFHVNNTELNQTIILPTLPLGWYFVDPSNHSIVIGEISIKPFTALYLIKTNQVRSSKTSLSPLSR